MRKLTTALLALPVVAAVYLSLVVRRSPLPRLVVALILMVALGLGATGGVGQPARINALPPSTPAPVLDPSLATIIETSTSPAGEVTLSFPAPMDRASVEALLAVDPPAPVSLAWAADGTQLTVRPLTTWQPGVIHTVSIDAGALDSTGRPIANAIRAVFLTRPATQVTLTPTTLVGGRAAISTGLTIQFDRPIDERTLTLQADPPVEGTFERIVDSTEANAYLFTPAAPLSPGTTYTFELPTSVLDVDGAPIVPPAGLVLETVAVPGVVRFRPVDGTGDVALGAALSVRFSEAMENDATAAAWSVTADGSPVSGSVSWAEGDTVLVFQPAAAFGYSQTVVMSVGEGARSQAGVPISGPASATFTTIAKPAPTPTRAPSPTRSPSPTGGGSVGAGTWAAVESYYLSLMNCTRTGGWVQNDGSCVGGGSGSTAPLWVDQGISSLVSRPYAKMEADTNQCSHFIGGTPGDRLAAAGYTSYTWAENLGCQSGIDPYASMLSTQLYFQNEKSTNGGHYVNLMNPKYDRCGLGVWVTSGRVRLVVDFYHP